MKKIEIELESSESLNDVIFQIESLPEFDLVILAAGYLPNELQDENLVEVRRALRINGESIILLLSAFAKRLSHLGGGKVLLISSVAATRPRIRNFTYGASKSAADFFAIGLASRYRSTGVDIKIIRPGFVFTKMTTDFKPAPFAITVEEVSRLAIKTLRGKRNVTYAPQFLKLVMNILRILPRRIFNRL